MNRWHQITLGVTLSSLYLGLMGVRSVWAGEVVSAQDGTQTNVTFDGNVFQINGGRLSGDGRNLFQSFQQFGLDADRVANFISNPQIQNILGRVVGGDPSIINGLIQVTGGNSNLYLMNPAGIIFGAGASLNVPGDFFATTATGIGFGDNRWFNAFGENDYAALTGNPSLFAFDIAQIGAIVNAGDLKVSDGQSITLLAGQAINTGSLTAPGGNIAIAAVPGSSLIKISQPGNLLSLEIAPPRDANGAALPFSARALPQLLTYSPIETGLTVNAGDRVQTSSGTAIPTTPATAIVTGTLDVSPSLRWSLPALSEVEGSGVEGSGVEALPLTPPQIAVIGDRISLLDATLNASAANGGGTIRVGGDYQGRGAIPNAEIVQINRNSRLNVDSLAAGNGGRAIVWADKTTQFLGSISARGGILGGNGGFVEVSGLRHLDYRGQVDTLAPLGRTGTLLLDPTDIIVTETGPFDFDDLSDVDDADDVDDIDPADVLVSTLDVDLLNNATTNIILQASNDITFETDVEIANFGVGLAVEAGNNITALGDIATNGGNIEFNAGNAIATKTLTSNGGDISLTASEGRIATGNLNASSTSQAGGSISIESGNAIVTGDLDASGATNGGNIEATSANRISIGAIDTSGDSGKGGYIYLLALDDISTDWLKAEGGNDGGNIYILTEGSFRATGTFTAKNGSNASISTIGGNEGGAINIVYDADRSFAIGNADENGTQGAITTGDFTLAPDLSFSSGAIEGNIEIIGYDSNVPDELDDEPEGDDSRENDPSEDDPSDSEIVARSNTVQGQDFDDVETVDNDFSNEYEDYSDVTDEIEEVSVDEAQANLREVETLTGIKPAVLYSVFVPSSAAEKSTSSQKHSRSNSDRLELVLVTSSGTPKRYPLQVTREQVMKVAEQFRTTVTNAKRRDAYLVPAKQLYQWLVAPLETDLKANNITNLSFVLESGLRSLPLAALHDGQGFIIERYSISLLPSIGLSDLRYVNLKDRAILAMGASTFTNQTPLPAVPTELNTIVNQLWRGEALLDNEFTLENLQQARARSAYSILHLATHGEFKPGKASDSYIQLWDSQLSLDRLRALRLNDPPVELMVLSACRTALGDEQAELGFAGLAVIAGVKTAMGSLWYVSDEGTLGLMTSFYTNLKDAPIKAEALRRAQLAMMRGEVIVKNKQLITPGGTYPLPSALRNLGNVNFRHPYFWSAFTMIGSPF